MASYTIHEDSVQVLGDAKVGLMITLTDEVNGKPDLTHYHEVESVDQEVIDATLAQLAQDYEDRPGKAEPRVPALAMGRVQVLKKDKPGKESRMLNEETLKG